jgi:hypothetical protein
VYRANGKATNVPLFNHLGSHGMLLEDLDNPISDTVKVGSKWKAEPLTINQLYSISYCSQQGNSSSGDR